MAKDREAAMGLTREIGEFVAGMRFERVPPGAIDTVCRGFTDCVGVMLAGLSEPVVTVVAKSVGFYDPVTRLADFGTPKVPAPELALIYGTAAHALDYDDTGLNGHPSAVLVPAILAQAREVGADGKAMIAAYVTGYEIWAELADREPDSLHQKGWHPSAMYGALATAGASAMLRRLDAEQATRAVGIAASLAGGVVANFGSMTKPFQLGRTAQSGLNATRLAQAGLTASIDAIEHELGFLRAISPRGAVDLNRPAQLGRRWLIEKSGINVKLYPMCFGAHRILDAMVDVCAAHKIAAPEIAGVDVELSENSSKVLRNHRPQTALEAKFSAEFAIAAAAITGRCGTAEVSNAFVARSDIQDFLRKVRIHPLTEKDPEEPTRSPFDRVRLTLTDGREIVSEAVYEPRGHFKRGVERDVLWRKFEECADGAVDRLRAVALFDALQNLPRLANVGDLRPQLASAAE
jgi:2-methylcitrate dehydratase PrpD